MALNGARQAARLVALAAPVVLAALHQLVFILRSHSTIDHFTCEAIVRPGLILLAAGSLVLAAFRLVTPSLRAASVAGTFFFVALGLYPFVFPGDVDRSWLVLAAFVLASAGTAVVLSRLFDGVIGVLISWAVAGIVVATAGATYLIAAGVWADPTWRRQVDEMIARAAAVRTDDRSERPDIYYIVLDGLARADILEDTYGVDVGESVERLEALGFQIPSRSRSNYPQTQLSLASALNMQYLDDLAAIMGDRLDRRPLIRLIAEAGAPTALQGKGYDMVAVKFESTTGADRDGGCRFSKLPSGPTDLELAVLKRLPLPSSLIHRATLRAHRQQVLRAFDAIETAASVRPMLLVAHVVTPHPPFVIADDGTERIGQTHFTFIDGDGFPGSRDEYIEGYQSQASFVLRRIAGIVERIIDRAPDSYIVIHSDHGSGLGLVNADAERTDAFERLSIFSAYYAGGKLAPVPETMSPVNAFRWVLRHALGADLPLLDDRSYISDYPRPYRLREIAPERLDPAR